MKEEYAAIIDNDDNIPVPSRIKEKMQIKKGDFLLIAIERIYGKENLPKGQKFVFF